MSANVAEALDAAVQRAERDEADLARLGRLPPVEYERVRAKEAQALGVRVGALDGLVRQARKRDGSPPPSGSGSPLDLADPEPWPEPVDGAGLLDELERLLGGLVVMPPEAAAATALWVAFSYAIDAAEFAPRLLVRSPERRCGKTTLLDALAEVCRRALPASNITAPALFRTIERARPTIVLDEADTFVRGNEELRGLINSGHRRSHAYVVRNVEVDGDFEPRKFSTWCAMAIAGIGGLHGTIEDRSVSVELRRKLPGERAERLDGAARERLRLLARKLRRWTDDHADRLSGAVPATPPELHDRAADNWRPLLAIADLAGGDWPARARAAARALSTGGDDRETARVLLLRDLRRLFRDAGDPAWLPTEGLLRDLAALEERPWAEWGKGRPITGQALRTLLAEFKVHSSHNAERTRRGYRREAFADAWARYLPEVAEQGPPIRPSVRSPGTDRASPAEPSVPGHRRPDACRPPAAPRRRPSPDGWTDHPAAGDAGMEEVRL